MTKLTLFKAPGKFIKNQIQKEFFGFLGGIFSVGILAYGIIFKDSRIQTSSLSATGFNEIAFSVPVYVIGIILVLLFILYIYFKRK